MFYSSIPLKNNHSHRILDSSLGSRKFEISLKIGGKSGTLVWAMAMSVFMTIQTSLSTNLLLMLI